MSRLSSTFGADLSPRRVKQKLLRFWCYFTTITYNYSFSHTQIYRSSTGCFLNTAVPTLGIKSLCWNYPSSVSSWPGSHRLQSLVRCSSKRRLLQCGGLVKDRWVSEIGTWASNNLTLNLRYILNLMHRKIRIRNEQRHHDVDAPIFPSQWKHRSNFQNQVAFTSVSPSWVHVEIPCNIQTESQASFKLNYQDRSRGNSIIHHDCHHQIFDISHSI